MSPIFLKPLGLSSEDKETVEWITIHHKLTSKQARVLVFIGKNNHLGLVKRTIVNYFFQKKEMSDKTCDKHIRVLLKEGFIEICTSKPGLKGSPLHLTKKGRSACDKLNFTHRPLYGLLAVFVASPRDTGKRLIGFRKTIPTPHVWCLPYIILHKVDLDKVRKSTEIAKEIHEMFADKCNLDISVINEIPIYDSESVDIQYRGFYSWVTVYNCRANKSVLPKPDDIDYAHFEYMTEEEYKNLSPGISVESIKKRLIPALKKTEVSW